MSGRQFEKQVSALGMTTSEFSRRSNVSISTLLKIYDNDTSVKASTKARAWNALKRIQAELEQGPKAQAIQDIAG